MKQVYQVSRPIKTSLCLVLTCVLFYSIYLFSLSWNTHSIFSVIVPIIMGTGALLFLINTIKRKVIISETSITQINLFEKKELQLKNVLGFRINNKMIAIEPIDHSYSYLSVYNYVRSDGNETLMQWLEKNLTDLNKDKI